MEDRMIKYLKMKAIRYPFGLRNAKKMAEYVAKNLDEIKRIFNLELSKEGPKERKIASEEIIKYLFSNRYEAYKLGFRDELVWSEIYMNNLITIANVVELANKGDRYGLIREMESLPWGDSNTGDQISHNATMFIWWLLSDETRKEFSDLFLKYCARANYEKVPSEETKEFVFADNPFKVSFRKTSLNLLKEYNDSEEKRLQEKIKNNGKNK